MANIFNPDFDNLFEEWIEQPELMHSLCRKAAKARNKMDVAKAAMEAVAAKASIDLRKNPTKFGLYEKVTEKLAEAAITNSEAFQKAQARYFDSKLEHGLAEAAVTAASNKKAALENLVILTQRELGASPKIRKSHSEKSRDKLRDSERQKYNVLKNQRRKK